MIEVEQDVQVALDAAVSGLTAREIRAYRYAVDRYLEGLEAPVRNYEAGYVR